VPCGLHPESGMPVGLQLLGRPFDEATMLRAARAYEREAPPLPAPPLSAGGAR
jgi:aspartyl-tRNA(Asn)/glutamyl-tRNA(Gln) amidotransferase subunit A